MPEADRPQFEKEVVQLPDGRRLIYYRFPEAPSPAAAAPANTQGSGAPGAAKKER
jgi:hypothetical protein